MCVRYVSFGSKVRPRTIGCIVMGDAVLSGLFSVRLFCFVQAKTLCRYDCLYFLTILVLLCVCVDVMVMSSA